MGGAGDRRPGNAVGRGAVHHDAPAAGCCTAAAGAPRGIRPPGPGLSYRVWHHESSKMQAATGCNTGVGILHCIYLMDLTAQQASIIVAQAQLLAAHSSGGSGGGTDGSHLGSNGSGRGDNGSGHSSTSDTLHGTFFEV